MKIGMCACGSMHCQFCSGLGPWNRPYYTPAANTQVEYRYLPDTNTASTLIEIKKSLAALLEKLFLLENKIDFLEKKDAT
jgi:hypothetical protein